MQYDNGFEPLFSFIFSIRPQIGGLGPKAQDPVISFCLCEGEYLTKLHLRSLAIKDELILTKDKKVQINNLTGKYIMEL